MTTIIKTYAVLGFILSTLIIIGLAIDIKNFDRTQGGYTAPYKGVTGEPVNWDSLDQTSTGLVKRGYIINVLVNGTTGMISFQIFNQTFAWRSLSERAIAVHKPRKAFIKRGFEPQF